MEVGYISRVITDADYYAMTQASYKDMKIGKIVMDEDKKVMWKVIDRTESDNGAQGDKASSVFICMVLISQHKLL